MTRMCEAVKKYGDECKTLERIKTQQEVIRSGLKMKMPLETIAQLVGLSVEEVQKFIDEMEK